MFSELISASLTNCNIDILNLNLSLYDSHLVKRNCFKTT